MSVETKFTIRTMLEESKLYWTDQSTLKLPEFIQLERTIATSWFVSKSSKDKNAQIEEKIRIIDEEIQIYSSLNLLFTVIQNKKLNKGKNIDNKNKNLTFQFIYKVDTNSPRFIKENY